MAFKRNSPIPVVEGGTNATSMTNTDGIVYFDGTRLVTTAVGTATNVLTSNGAGVAPTFQSLPSGAITINGDSGSASGTTLTFNAKGSNLAGGTTSFTASGSTVDLKVTDTNFNTAIGRGAAAAGPISSGNQNTAVGFDSLNGLTTGRFNTAMGYAALAALSGQDGNTAIGDSALNAATTNCSNNTALGYASLSNLANGAWNVGLGESAGSSYTTSESSNIIINAAGTAAESNVLRIGSATGTGNQQLAKAFICGIDGVNVGSVAKVVTEASNQLGTATITAGTNISIVPTANTITINGTGMAAFTWSVITANQTAAVNNGYIANKAGTLALALPATSAVGDMIRVTGINTATGWQITQASGQQIFFGTTQTTSGATGTLTSSAIRDAIEIVCIAANTTWQVLSVIGNITVV